MDGLVALFGDGFNGTPKRTLLSGSGVNGIVLAVRIFGLDLFWLEQVGFFLDLNPQQVEGFGALKLWVKYSNQQTEPTTWSLLLTLK